MAQMGIFGPQATLSVLQHLNALFSILQRGLELFALLVAQGQATAEIRQLIGLLLKGFYAITCSRTPLPHQPAQP